MKIIHLGPFSGNMGDLFSYISFQNNFRKYVQEDIEFHNINIRDFYFNCRKRLFDDQFLNEINTSDLFILGGGQYFDVKWENSETGTTLNFSKEFIDGIKVPVLINSIGYTEPEKGTLQSEQDVYEKFSRFISYIGPKENWLITVRSDGSYGRMIQRFGPEVMSKVHEVPDNGLYFDKDVVPCRFENRQRTVGIQLTDYMFTTDKTIDLDLFYSQIGKLISEYICQGCRVILFPHVPQDLVTITRVMKELQDNDIRNNVVVAPYNTLDIHAARIIVGMYKACDFCIAMRFHANIIAIQNEVPTIALCVKGLGSHRRIIGLYEWLGLSDTIIETGEIDNISDMILEKERWMIANANYYKEQVREGLKKAEKEKDCYFNLLRQFITKQIE